METFLDPTSQCSPTLSESHLIPNKFVPAIQKYLKKKEERYNFAVHNENALKKKSCHEGNKNCNLYFKVN